MQLSLHAHGVGDDGLRRVGLQHRDRQHRNGRAQRMLHASASRLRTTAQQHASTWPHTTMALSLRWNDDGCGDGLAPEARLRLPPSAAPDGAPAGTSAGPAPAADGRFGTGGADGMALSSATSPRTPRLISPETKAPGRNFGTFLPHMARTAKVSASRCVLAAASK